jgi:DNA-binding CsgD family transcriptional regulator
MTHCLYTKRTLSVVAQCVARDATQPKAAEMLNISRSTVNAYFQAVKAEAGVKTSNALALWMVFHGYLIIKDDETGYEFNKNANHTRHRN